MAAGVFIVIISHVDIEDYSIFFKIFGIKWNGIPVEAVIWRLIFSFGPDIDAIPCSLIRGRISSDCTADGVVVNRSAVFIFSIYLQSSEFSNRFAVISL